MKVTFKTLKREQFKLDVEPTDTILSVKEKVGKKQNVEDYKGYRLIYQGKVLKDAMTVSGCGIKETGFMVIMPPKKVITKDVKKEKPASAPAPTPTPAPAPAPKKEAPAPKEEAQEKAIMKDATPEPEASPAEKESKETAGTPKEVKATSTESSGAGPISDSSLVTGAQYEAAVKGITEMGFPEDRVKLAMRAAFNNPDRAVEYLFNGIPDVPMAPTGDIGAASLRPPRAAGAPRSTGTPPTTTPSTGTPTATQGGRSPTTQPTAPGTPFDMFAGGRSGGRQGGNLEFLRQRPGFVNLRRALQSNPNLLPQILSQIEQTDPELRSLIQTNPAEFLQLLNETFPGGEQGGEDELAALQALAASGRLPPNAHYVSVSQEEHEQLDRLNELGASMGLNRQNVLQTWLACDRNETLAANYMADHRQELQESQEDFQDPNEENPTTERPNPPES